MKPVFASAHALPTPVKNLLEEKIGEHGIFTFQPKPGGDGYVVARFDELRSHSKPSILKSLGNEGAYKVKLQQYRAEKSLNLRDSLFAALAKTPFTAADADAAEKIATKLAKQHLKGGWPSGSMSWGAGQTPNAAVQSAAKLVDDNLSAMLYPDKGQGKPLSFHVRGALLELKKGLEPPSAPEPILAGAHAQQRSDTGNSSMAPPLGAKQTKGPTRAIATTRADEKTESFPTDRLGQMKRDEKVWINLRHRLFNGDRALLDVMGHSHENDAQKWLTRVSNEIRTLGGNPDVADPLTQNPLPKWIVKDLPLIADTIRALKKRYAVEQLGLLAAGRAGKDLDTFSDAMRDSRLTDVLVIYEGLHAGLEEMAGRRGIPSRAPQVPAGGGAQHDAGGMDNARATLRGRLAEAATTVRDYERGLNGITAEQCSTADATMDLLLEELGQLKQRDAQEQLEALDVGATTTMTTTVGATTTTTTTTTNTTTSTATAGATPGGSSTTTVLPGGGNSSFRS